MILELFTIRLHQNMSSEMRTTRSRSRRIPRESSRHRPTPPRSPAALTRIHTQSPSGATESVLTTEPAQALPPRTSEQGTRNQTGQPTLVSLPRTPQNPTNATQESETTDPTDTNRSRPPTPNWPGFAPPPDFQAARERDRAAYEAGETPIHPHHYSRIWNNV